MDKGRVTLSRIDDKLENVLDLLRGHIDDDNKRFGKVDGNFEKVQNVILGNGKPGLITRLDRLEQTEAVRKWVIRALVGAVCTGIATLAVRGL